MSSTITWLCPRGHVIKTNSGGGSTAYIYVSGLSGQGRILMQGVPSSAQDIAGATAALGGGKTLFSFGKAFGGLDIHGIILLGDCRGQSASNDARIVEGWFNTHRLANAKKPVSVSVGGTGGGKSIYPINLKLGDIDSARHIQTFAISCIVVEI